MFTHGNGYQKRTIMLWIRSKSINFQNIYQLSRAYVYYLVTYHLHSTFIMYLIIMYLI